MSFVLCACGTKKASDVTENSAGSEPGADIAQKWIDASNAHDWDALFDMESSRAQEMEKNGGEDKAEFWRNDKLKNTDYELERYVGEKKSSSEYRKPDDGKVYIWEYSYKRKGFRKTKELRVYKENGEWKAN